MPGSSPVHGVSMAKQMPSAINAVTAKPCRQTGKHSKNRRRNETAADAGTHWKNFATGVQDGMQLFSVCQQTIRLFELPGKPQTWTP